jgi:RNase P subunit RPR2
MREGFIFLEGKEGKQEQAEENMQDETSFKELSDEIIREMKAWNASNPKATFLEIEVKARELVSQLEAHLIQASAGEREREDWAQREERERPTCPNCQRPLLSRGKRVRHLQGTAGRDIHLQRTYGTCPNCGTGFFPPR